eukprot:CAMPEP_0114554240 /NCGR_PEP_ID=MMETSP0114-20121206/8105_1 /TAXON_ID=31324 /ORGANISM="Goniomonas sp, Strain m" /LENGTH=631 /DNA_ID=CAMNT_0001739275 /DNA_START=6 /DNA_END=1901 /DNA_ORIENTATION=+
MSCCPLRKALPLVAAGGVAFAVYKLFRVYVKAAYEIDCSKFDSGGKLIAAVLKKQGVQHLFCLSGGHVSPVYVEAERVGIKVVDVRHEVNSVFAADAVARVTGVPGVAVVTAGPGVTNTVTAVKNAQMAESPVIILGGCTSILLMGRGSLQDIDHLSVMKSIVKWSASPRSVKELIPCIERAFVECRKGVPGPVFIELPMDLTWPAHVTKEVVGQMAPKGNSFPAKIARGFLQYHMSTIFAGAMDNQPGELIRPRTYTPSAGNVRAAVAAVTASQRPVIVIGSQAMHRQSEAHLLADAVAKLGIPVFVSGMARGLMGRDGRGVQFVHNRSAALKNADLVIFAGVVADFRMNYGVAVNPRAHFITVNRSRALGTMNSAIKSPDLFVMGDSALFLMELSKSLSASGAQPSKFAPWLQQCRDRENEKEAAIAANAAREPKAESGQEPFLNPVHLCREIEKVIDDNAVVCVDGGDFVGTAAYTLHPRQPLGWLDPGAFGTLGVGAGFAMGVKTAQPDKEVWIMYGDGALGFSMIEFDTMVRHKLGVIAIIGNDALWAQMIRDQDRLLGSTTACHLNRTAYDKAVIGLGAHGLELKRKADIPAILAEAKAVAKTGVPVLVNCFIGRNDFREGAISV